jgi:hypothetical protein
MRLACDELFGEIINQICEIRKLEIKFYASSAY